MTQRERKRTLAAQLAAKSLDRPKILFAASECAPLAKTGGLADVVGTLPRYLNALGFDARVIVPYHRVIKSAWSEKVEYLFSFEIKMGWRTRFVGMNKLMLDGLTVYLVENDGYFSGPIYAPGAECEQYGYFTRALLEACERLDFVPDVIHANDWHTALIPLLLKSQYTDRPIGRAKTLLTIHNIAYQGLCSFDFTSDWMSIDPGWGWALERYGDRADFLKAGCVLADRVNTVSPNYAREITTPEYGEGLDGVLRERGAALGGIVNGVEGKVWSCSRDKQLPARYSAKDLSGKQICKQALLDEFGFDGGMERPLFSMVSRLAEQKGIQLVIDAMDALMAEDMSLLILGNGERGYEDFFRAAEARYPGRVRAVIGYEEPLAHRIYAGSDFFLMPSRFEPCGISQLIAMRYGTVPIVRATGGLRDTVQPYNRYTGAGDGFCFDRYDAEDMLGAVRYALACWPQPEIMDGLRQSCMSHDFGCDAWAYEYAMLYLDML